MEWFEHWFGEEYLLVYDHRDIREAETESEAVIGVIGLGKGEVVLDLCCGSGRHTGPLVRQGCRVWGLDYSSTLLRQAQKNIPEHASYPRYVRGDVRRVPFRDRAFDAVLNMFTSFGYFSDEENEAMMGTIARILRPKGRFFIDYLNPYRIVETLVPVTERETNGLKIREERFIDEGTKRVKKTIRLTDSTSTRTFYESVRLYTELELRDMIARAGMSVDGIAGSMNLSPYDESAERMIVWGTRVS